MSYPHSMQLAVPTIALLILLLGACSAEVDSPEARLQRLIQQAETASEEQNIAILRDMVSANYSDERGHDKRSVETLVRYYFLQNRSIHLFTKIADLSISDSGHNGHATVYAAMAARPIESADALDGIRADLHRFELDFVEESGEGWLLIRAHWRRAAVDDFL